MGSPWIKLINLKEDISNKNILLFSKRTNNIFEKFLHNTIGEPRRGIKSCLWPCECQSTTTPSSPPEIKKFLSSLNSKDFTGFECQWRVFFY